MDSKVPTNDKGSVKLNFELFAQGTILPDGTVQCRALGRHPELKVKICRNGSYTCNNCLYIAIANARGCGS